MTRSTIALCIIAKNKESIIERMLDSTKGVFDLYCLEDTGSTDHTMDVFTKWCEKNKRAYKISQHEYRTVEENGKKHLAEFGKARNYSFELAKGCDYAFWMDTDDILIGAEEIPRLVEMMAKDKFHLGVLKYNYATFNGMNISEQRRERIIDIKRKGKWIGWVHENYEFDDSSDLKLLNIDGVEVQHLRSVKESMDTGRRNNKILNLKIKEEGLKSMTDKELWDLAFDHFERGEYKEAEKYFLMVEKHAKDLLLDRRLDLYAKLARINLANKKLELAVTYLFRILQERQDTNVYVQLGEIFAQLRDWDSLESCAKKVLKMGKPKTSSVINETEYTITPRKMLMTAYVGQGKYDEALQVNEELMQMLPTEPSVIEDMHSIQHEKDRAEFIRTLAKFNKYIEKIGEFDKSPQLLGIIPEEMKEDGLIKQLTEEISFDILRKQKKTLSGKKTIDFYCGGHLEKWNGKSDIEKGIGGSEGMVIMMARELAKLGNKVRVFCETDDDVIDKVEYIDHRKWSPDSEVDVFIGVRTAGLQAMNMFVKAKKQYLYLHDTHYGDVPQMNFNLFNKVLVLSEFHKDVIKKRHGLTNDSLFYVTRNAFNDKAVPKTMPERNPNKIIYASSYDRGLDTLLEMWPEIKARLPLAELHIYYGWNTYDGLMEARRSEPMKLFKEKVLKLMDQDGVFEHGRVSQKKLYKEFASSNVWFYPTSFEEISCITAMQAQLMGAIPVCTPVGALVETVNKKYGVMTGHEKIVDALVHTMQNYKEDRRLKMMEDAQKRFNVTDLAKDWDNLYNSEN